MTTELYAYDESDAKAFRSLDKARTYMKKQYKSWCQKMKDVSYSQGKDIVAEKDDNEISAYDDEWTIKIKIIEQEL